MDLQYQGDYYYKHNPTYHRFAEFMGLDREKRMDLRHANKLALIYDWAESRSDNKNTGEILLEVNNLKKGLGTTDKGEELVNKLYRYVRLDESRKEHIVKQRELESQMEAEGGLVKTVKEGKEQEENRLINREKLEQEQQEESPVQPVDYANPEAPPTDQ